MPVTERQVEWRIDASSSRVLRVLAYGWVGLFGGGLLLLIGLLLLLAVGAAVRGEFALFGVIVLLLLVGGPFSLLYLLPAVQSGSFSPPSRLVLDVASDPAEPLGDRYARAFSWWGVLASIGLHLIAIPALVLIDPRLLGGYVVGLVASLLLASVVTTWGRIDPDEPSFEYRAGTIPLEAVKRVRRLRIGSVVVCWLSYHSGTKSFTTPSLVVLTPEATAAFDDALAIVDRTPPDPDGSAIAPTVVAVGMGVGCLAFAGWLWVFVDVDPAFASYVLVVFGGLGLFFTWVGLSYT